MNNSECRLRTGILADIHVWDKTPLRAWKLNRALGRMKKLKVDAFLSLGDTTDHGNEGHWILIDECFIKHCPCDDLVIAIGNHDTWTPCPEGTSSEERARTANNLYMEHRKIISGREYDGKVYFSHEVGGYTFICLGSEGDGLGALISDEQIAWLDNELQNATKDGKPVFVSCHQALNRTHGLPVTFDKELREKYEPMRGGIGEKSDEIKAVMAKYKNVFFFSGHSHMGLVNAKDWSTYEKVDGIHSFNLPCYMFPNHHGVSASGYGYLMDVYDDRVEMLAYNFNTGKPNHEFDYIIRIKRTENHAG